VRRQCDAIVASSETTEPGNPGRARDDRENYRAALFLRFGVVDTRVRLRPGVALARAAAVATVDACRFVAAIAWPRAAPSIAFSPLSHMLRNGFFFIQGLAISRFPIA